MYENLISAGLAFYLVFGLIFALGYMFAGVDLLKKPGCFRVICGVIMYYLDLLEDKNWFGYIYVTIITLILIPWFILFFVLDLIINIFMLVYKLGVKKNKR